MRSMCAGRISACALANAAASAGVGVLVIVSLLVVLEVGNLVLEAWGGVNVHTVKAGTVNPVDGVAQADWVLEEIVLLMAE